MLERLGGLCARKHWAVMGVWLVVAVALFAVGAQRHGDPEDVFTIPGAPSQRALDLLASDFPEAAGTSATVVFEATSGTLQDPGPRAAIDDVIARLSAIDGAVSVSSPFVATPTGIDVTGAEPSVVSEDLNITADGTVGFSVVRFTQVLDGMDTAKPLFEELQASVADLDPAELRAELGGPIVGVANAPDPGISQYSELIGLLFAVGILLVTLGSFTSMAVPIGIALISVALSHTIVDILQASFTVGSVAPILGSMIGLGVGIDYSLFIVSRYRQFLREGLPPDEAVARSVATSGSAVLFAGITVCIALAGLALVRIPYVAQLGFVAALFVAVTLLTALTLLPAVLGALGPRIDAGRIHHRDEDTDIHRTLSARWASATSRHPKTFVVVSLLVLLVLASPLRGIHLGFTDDGNLSRSLTQRQAYDLLTENFGPGQNGPLLLAIELPEVTADNTEGVVVAFASLNQAIAATEGVQRVSLPVPNALPSPEDPTALPTAAIMEITPTTAPNANATTDLVHQLRDHVIPEALEGSAIPASQVFVGGQTAILIDLTETLQGRLFAFIAVVLLGSFLLLMMVFRSVFVPFKAALMNLLSIGGAYGVVIAMFQWGWGKDLIGLESTVPIVAFVPVMMFAVLFGLSMDYEVFLIARIKEEYTKSGDSRESVVTGLAATARVITAAALIMIAVFVSFVPNPDPTVKMIGLGMAVAVLIDATIVRMVLVPSSMELAGKANWWLPGWLDKVLPRINID